MQKPLSALILALLCTTLLTASSAIYKVTAPQPFAASMHALKTSLETQHLFIIAKADISGTLARMKGKLGKDYNKRGYDKVNSIVFCNPFYANDILNSDPDMMALCPLKIMLLEKNGKTTALFVPPTALSGKSPARKILSAVERKVKMALKAAGFRWITVSSLPFLVPACNAGTNTVLYPNPMSILC